MMEPCVICGNPGFLRVTVTTYDGLLLDRMDVCKACFRDSELNDLFTLPKEIRDAQDDEDDEA